MDEVDPTNIIPPAEIAQPGANGEPKKQPKVRKCPHCGQLRELKSPWQELFRLPTFQEWLVLFMIIMALFMAWAYKHDTAVCREYAENIDAVCPALKHNVTHFYNPQRLSDFNLTEYVVNDSIRNASTE